MKYLAILRGGALKRGPPPIFPLSADPLAVESSWNAITPCRRASRVSSCLSSPSFHPTKTIARARDTWSVDDRDRSTFLPPPPLFTGFDRSIRRPHLAPLGGNAAWKRKTAGWKSKSTSHRERGEAERLRIKSCEN